MIRNLMMISTLTLGFATAAMADAERKGQFTGASNHITTGWVELGKSDAGYILTLGADFSLDGAPDPKVGFGKDGEFVEGTLIGELQSLKGEQVYLVPANLDVSEYTDVFIWCEQFSVPLGTASLD